MTGQEDTDVTAVERPGVPLRRPGDAREVAAVVAFPAGDTASYVTGSSYVGPQAGSHLRTDDWRRP